MEDLPRTIQHARLYPVRWQHQRLIVHDGTRWRRVSEPWRVNLDRPIPTELSSPASAIPEGVRMDMIRALPVTITLDAPGYEHAPVARLEHVA